MKANGWLAWLQEEKIGIWNLAVKHREDAELIAQELDVSCVLLETRVHLAGALLRNPGACEADRVRAAVLLESVALVDCEQRHLRQRQILLAQIDLRRGNANAGIDRLRDLMSEIPSDDPDRERWVGDAYSLFVESHAVTDARACVREMLVNARARNDQAGEWRLRACEASLTQQGGEDGWQDRFAALLGETWGCPEMHGAIARVASEAYFNAGLLDRAINLARAAREIQQQQGYFGGIVATEAWLARLYDRAGDFKHACRYATLAILTAIFNCSYTELDGLRGGLKCWSHYPEVHQALNGLLNCMTGASEMEEFDGYYSALTDLNETTNFLTEGDVESLAVRQRVLTDV